MPDLRPAPPTSNQVRHVVGYLQDIAFTIANRRHLIDASSQVDAEISRMTMDMGEIVRAVGQGIEGRKTMAKKFANLLLRTCTVAQLAGVNLGDAVLERVQENAKAVR